MLKISMPGAMSEAPTEEEQMPEAPAVEEMMSEEAPMEAPMESPAPATLPKSLVLYMGSEFGPFRCDNCCYFNDDESCQVVGGPIDPGGHCNVYCPPNHDALDEAGGEAMHEAMEAPTEEMMETEAEPPMV